VESEALDALTRQEVRRSSLRNAGVWKVDTVDGNDLTSESLQGFA
jgi:hypothetical protein